jgi:hypothetical protein
MAGESEVDKKGPLLHAFAQRILKCFAWVNTEPQSIRELKAFELRLNGMGVVCQHFQTTLS